MDVAAGLSNADKIAALERMLADAKAQQPAQVMAETGPPIGEILVPSELNDLPAGYDVPFVPPQRVAASPASSEVSKASSVLEQCSDADGSPSTKKRRVQVRGNVNNKKAYGDRWWQVENRVRFLIDEVTCSFGVSCMTPPLLGTKGALS